MKDYKFKYYHGTSDIFLESIRQHGLGGINPNFDFKNLEVLKFLYEKAEEELVGIPKYETWRKSIKAMVYQTDLELHHDNGTIEKLNYRHDGMYISLSRQRAAIYACLNKFGSEVLESCLMMIGLLRESGVDVSIPADIDLFGVERYIHANPKPIIVEIFDIADHDLEKEDGKTAPEALNFIRETLPCLTEKEQFEFLQFCNFKALKPVLPQNLKFYEVEYEGHPKDQNFFFTLSRI